MGNYVYAQNSACIYMSHLLCVEFNSSFQYVEGVTALAETRRALDTCQETSGPWELGRCHKYLVLCNRHINCILLQERSAVQKLSVSVGLVLPL